MTGAASGIGVAIALRLAREGADVAVNHVGDQEAADEIVQQISQLREQHPGLGRALAVRADVAVESDVVRMFREVTDRFGPVDLLVNNAGVQAAADSEQLSADDFDRVVAIDLRGAFLCAREALRGMLSPTRDADSSRCRGAIVNISSVHEVIPKPGYLGYSVSKGGLRNLTRTLALEYAGRGIRVNAVGPGATITPINTSWTDDPDKRRDVERHIPMRRAGTAEEMAAAAAFLLSADAGYITGQTLFVDGGLTLYPSFETDWSS